MKIHTIEYREDAEVLYREFISDAITDGEWLHRTVDEWNNDVLHGSSYLATEVISELP